MGFVVGDGIGEEEEWELGAADLECALAGAEDVA